MRREPQKQYVPLPRPELFQKVKEKFDMLNWNTLIDAAQLNDIKTESFKKPQVLFKHSTRCRISSLALKRIERAADIPDADFHFLDLLRFRNVSDKIAEEFSVYHESPQILVIKNARCVYDESHLGINIDELQEQIFSAN